ncbi:hypothetical protein QZH41_020225 [Actinostola sp. cb2023]|nr:hypothetical protein QZH41_020225 [Actinostola sp. cb2023]
MDRSIVFGVVFLCAVCVAKSPNILLILTDDQDKVLQGMIPLTKTKKLIGEKGISFENMKIVLLRIHFQFVTSPLCCPSRSSILTGKYIHNHHAINNSVEGNCANTHWQQGPEKYSIATYLKGLNYTTIFAGKYLNQYGFPDTGGPQRVPPGWDRWYGLIGNSKYYNYTLSVNGKPERHGTDYEKDYFTDVISRYAVSFLQGQASNSSPFFMFLSTPSCHGPFTPAPQYKDEFEHSKAPRTTSFNKAGGQDKHWLIRHTPNPMASSSIEYSDDVFRNRLRTLLSVDDLVEQVITTLTKIKQLENTYIIYTSDNGYHLGQFSLPIDKRQLYEFDIRVPFLITGPGIPTNKSLQNTGMKWREDFLVQHVGEGHEKVDGCPKLTPGFECCKPNCVCEDSWNNTYSCVRTLSSSQDLMFCEFQDKESFIEFYNLKNDPHQLSNIAKKVDRRVLAAQRKRLEELVVCSGDSCRHNYNDIHDCKYTCHWRCLEEIDLDCIGAWPPSHIARNMSIDEMAMKTLHLLDQDDPKRNEPYLMMSTNISSGSLRRKIESFNTQTTGLIMTMKDDSIFQGFVRVHMNLLRPINIVAGQRPLSIFEIVAGSIDSKKSQRMSFFLPLGTVKALHVTSETTVQEVIEALLKKFKIADNPRKFALFECYQEQDDHVILRRMADIEKPLMLRLLWGGPDIRHSFSLQENETGDIVWEVFSIPELLNFLKILDKEEEEHLTTVRRVSIMMCNILKTSHFQQKGECCEER